MNSIHVHAKEWFDKINGNSYFSARISIDGELVAALPYEYGYGDQYMDAANTWLAENGKIDNPRNDWGRRVPLWSYCQDHGIALYQTKVEKCKKRDVIAWGEL